MWRRGFTGYSRSSPIGDTRVRNLVDLVLLHEHDLLDPGPAAEAIRGVWDERGETLPERLPPPPAGWPDRNRAMVAELDVGTTEFTDAVALVTELWATRCFQAPRLRAQPPFSTNSKRGTRRPSSSTSSVKFSTVRTHQCRGPNVSEVKSAW